MLKFPCCAKYFEVLTVFLLTCSLGTYSRRIERRQPRGLDRNVNTSHLVLPNNYSLLDVGRSDLPLPNKRANATGSTKPEPSENSKTQEPDTLNTMPKEEINAREEKERDKYGFFEPLPVPWSYYVTLFGCFLFLFGVTHVHRCTSLKPREVELSNIRSEFFEFKRPKPSATGGDGGFFNPANCPMPPRGGLQMWFRLHRWAIWMSIPRTVPMKSLRYALQISTATAILWILMFLAIKKKVLNYQYVTFNGPGQWMLREKDSRWFPIMTEGVGGVSAVVKFLLAFFLLWGIRVRYLWFSGLKTKVWNVQKSVELVAFITGAFLSGDDVQRSKARHDIHRWLTAAHFWNYQPLSEHLAQFDEQDLYQQGVLNKNEADIISSEVAVDRTGEQPRDDVAGAEYPTVTIARARTNRGYQSNLDIDETQRLMNPQSGMTVPVQIATNVRDLILYWIQVRIQAAVKEKLMDKDKLKKILGALWRVRNDMQAVVMDSDERQMYLVVVMMQVFVDIYVSTGPLATLGMMYHEHIWTLPWTVLEAFILSFLYDLLLQIYIVFATPFGIDMDNLHIDPLLVLTERITFFNLGRCEQDDLPGPLGNIWKAGKADKAEKGEKAEKAEKEDKGKGEKSDK
eukprot:gnl/MRDRNA2_/MRDRNA2_63829_c0_seq1.p1 gnl/MRDRNA2_/MRDRNA2_63829_c0~~gnl/MRDRNA2_/MRDRNA2_63829_c0_seq1.p1  ORF type:complete len:627 (-),score=90.02 gnl/MRDRNA2_/MRDRNA2_63829_c0_seq1:102-1982(-)